MDQRGSGQSAPLKCPELSFSDPLVPVLDAGAAARCRARLSTSADLAAYSTAESVTDLEALRAALGHRQIDLIALSYGTRVAQEYLRRYPARVRAVALLGAVAPDALVPLSYTESAQAVLEALARDCAADAQCRKAVPDLRADIGHVARQLAAGEVLAAAPGGNSIPAEPGPFWQALRAKLISTDSQRQLPWLLHQAAAGRFGPILAALQPAGGGDSSDGMLLSITCPEDTLHITPEQLAAVPTSVFGTYRQEQQLAACRAWGVPRTEPVRDWVQGPTPVLLVAGAMDHVTPPTMAHAIASRLTHARVIEIPYLGHMPGGLDHMECYDQVINQFFDQGSAAELALDCLSAMQPPAFVLGG
jgi:pimeloyl-ACP methyl ester carboxylesterase